MSREAPVRFREGLGVKLPRATRLSRDDRWLALGVFGPEVGRWEVSTGEEYRVLTGHPGQFAVGGLDISPDGRWLASAAGDGARLWDLATDREVATLPLGSVTSVVFDPDGRSLITCGHSGLHRWRIRFEAPAPSPRSRIGPPVPVSDRMPRTLFGRASLSRVGRTLAAATEAQALVFDLDRPRHRPWVLNSYTTSLGLSPDARWLATNAEHAFESKLWDARARRWARTFPGMRTAFVRFSPDNRWLVFATAQEYLIYEVGSWRPGPRVHRDHAGVQSGLLAFTRGGETVAIAHSARDIRLLDAASGRELATLAAPVPDTLFSLCVSPDGGRLAAGTKSGVIQLWDLRRIRRRLRLMGLDWDLAAQLSDSADGREPMRFEVDLGEPFDTDRLTLILALSPFDAEAYYRRGLAFARRDRLPEALDDFRRALALKPGHGEADYHRGLVLARQRKEQEAIAAWSRAVALKPDHAEAHAARGDAYGRLGRPDDALLDYARVVALRPDWSEYLNEAAWPLATHPDPRRRDIGRAVAWARRAVALEPDRGMYQNTLGVALYRAGDWPGAIEALEKSAEFQGRTSYDDFFLAMCRWRLGERPEALRLYDQAVRWMDRHRPGDDELRRFRAEAAELLGISDPSRSGQES
jgi:tetratricopeptide (TPR) repeat protein